MIKLMSILFATFCVISTPKFPQSKKEDPFVPEQQMITRSGNNAGVSMEDKYGPISIPTYPQNKSFLSYYFGNLEQNFGANTHGTCGFIALEMLLSYYDTVWNDNIVPEAYDSVVDCTIDNEVRTASTSPGTLFEWGYIQTMPELEGLTSGERWNTIQNYGYSEYWNYMNNNKDKSLHLQLLSYYFPQNPSILAPFYWNMSGNIGSLLSGLVAVAYNYISDKTPFSPEQFDIQYATGIGSGMRQQMKQLVQSGKPVLVCANNHNGSEKHAFVVYDYDEYEDEFYCHTGWYSTNDPEYPYNVRMPLSKFEFPSVYGMMWFNPTSVPKNRSNNYKHGTHTFSPFDSMRPRNVRVANDLYLDELPEFKWDSMIDYNLFSWYEKSYNAYICDADTNAIITLTDVHGNGLRLTNSQYSTLLSTIETDYFWFVLEFYPDTYDNLIFLRVDMPTTYSNKVHVKPCDWNSSWDRGISIPNNTITETQTINGMTFSTKRTRAWRDGSWIVVQPKKTNNNVASLEIDFTDHVGAFMYSLAKRDATETFGTVTVQVKDSNGNWSTIETVTTSLLPIAASGHPRRTIWVDSPGSSSFFPGGHGRKNITAIKFTNTCKYNFAGALCIDDLAFDNEDVEFLNVYNYQNSWYTGYGKSCLPNNVPASGNSTGGFLNPTNPDDPIIIGTK